MRRDACHITTVDFDLDICQHGRRDPFVEAADLGVDPFFGRHVVAGADEASCERVQQDGVHVVADAEGEELRSVRRFLLCDFEDGGRVLHSDRGQAVRQEDHRRGSVAGQQVEGGLQCACDVGSAGGVEVPDEAEGVAGLGGIREAVSEDIDAAGEADHGEAVIIAESVEDVGCRVPRLLDFFAFHRAGCVQHEHDVTRHCVVDLERRREQQREESIVGRLAVGECACGDQALAAGDVCAEAGGGVPIVTGLPACGQFPVTVAVHVQAQAWREDRARLPRHVDLHGDSSGRGTRGHSRPRDFRQHLFVGGHQGAGHGEADGALLACWYGECPHLVEVVAEGAKQCRVDQARDDIVVELRGFAGVHQAPLQCLGPTGEEQVRYGASWRHGDDDTPFREPVRGIRQIEPVSRHQQPVAQLELCVEPIEVCYWERGPPAVEASLGWHGGWVDRLLASHCRGQQRECDDQSGEYRSSAAHGCSLLGWLSPRGMGDQRVRGARGSRAAGCDSPGTLATLRAQGRRGGPG